MLKLLTEYNKYIMAGISMLLLVVFLAPTAVSKCSSANTTRATAWARTADGGVLTVGDMDTARGQLQALAKLRSLWRSVPTAQNVIMGNPGLFWLDMADPKDAEQWWLLAREARAAGLVGGKGDGRALLDDLAPAFGVPAEQVLHILAAESRQPTGVVLDGLADLAGIGRMVELVAAAPRSSEARTKLLARELMTSVNCDVVPLNALLVGDSVPVPVPTPEQLQAQFESARDNDPGTGPFGAGYRIANKVSIEWLAVPAAEIARGAIGDPKLGAVELRKEFLKNPAAYAPPAAPGAEPVVPAFEEVRDQVREAVRLRIARERSDRIAQFIRDWARGTVQDLPSAAGFVQLPADWRTTAPPMTKLAEELVNRFQVPMPRVGDSGPDPVLVSDVDGTLFIGRASTNEFGQAFSVGQLVALLHEFNPEAPFPLQVGVVGPVLTTPGGDLIAYRVRQAVPAHAPASINEVMAEVVRDATAKLRYDALVAMAPAILAEAEKDGLSAVANRFGSQVEVAPQVSLANTMSLARGGLQPTPLSQAGPDADAVRAVVQRAVSLPTDVPVSTLPDTQRMLTVPVAKKQVLLIVRINSITPLSQEIWAMLNSIGAFRRAMSQSEPSPNLAEVFGPEAVKKRHGLTLLDPTAPDRPAPPPRPML